MKHAGYRTKPVRIEMRDNLLDRLRRKERVLPGIVGYDDTVLPEIENGMLAGHHMILLGERGQAKSRIIRSLASLLDEHVAAINGCEISDDPYAPICGDVSGADRGTRVTRRRSCGSRANIATPKSSPLPMSRWPI